MKKTLILLVLVTIISCGLKDFFNQQEYIWPENVQELLTGKWQLTMLDGADALNEQIFIEYRADSTYWKYSLTDSVSVAAAAAGVPADSAVYYTWLLDADTQLIKLTSFTPWYIGGTPSIFVWDGGNYKINLITEETLVLKKTVDYVGFDPYYGSGGGTTNRPAETYVKIP